MESTHRVLSVCGVSLVVEKWSIYRFKVEKHEVIKDDVFFYNGVQGIMFGYHNLEPNIQVIKHRNEKMQALQK